MPPKRYESLDGLRGICALMVAAEHCDGAFGSGRILNHAYLCVDAFFVLSGFVIAMAFEEKLRQGLTLSAFVRARARRLLPVHFLGTAIVAAVILSTFAMGYSKGSGFDLQSMGAAALLGMLLIPNFVFPSLYLFPINIPLWSLWDEWIVNVLYAKIFGAWRLRAVAGTAIACWGFLAAYGALTGNTFSAGTTRPELLLGLLRAFGGFLAGVATFRLFNEGRFKTWPIVRPLLVYSWVFAIALIPDTVHSAIFDLLAVLTIPPAIALLAVTPRATPAPFRFLGVLSYPLYVTQSAAIVGATAFLSMGRHSSFVDIPIILAALAVAWIVSRATGNGLRYGATKRTGDAALDQAPA